MASNDFWVVIYRDYDENAADVVLSTNRHSKMVFETLLPGGYGRATFEINADISRSPQYYRYLLSKHIVIFDRYGDRVYEGSIEDTKSNGDRVSVSAYGYYHSATFVSAGPSFFSGYSSGAILGTEMDPDFYGDGYYPDDILTISAGDSNAEITVISTDGQPYDDENPTTGGAIIEYLVTAVGTGYSVATEITLTNKTVQGTPAGAKIDVTQIEVGSNAMDIIKFLVDLQPRWRDDYSHLLVDDQIPVGPFEWGRETKISAALPEVLKYGYLDPVTGTRRPIHLVIWENRVVRAIIEPDIQYDNPDWLVSIHSLMANKGVTLSIDTASVRNKVYVTYNDRLLEGSSTTAAGEDENSQFLFGVREGNLNIGNASVDIAELARTLAVKNVAFPQQTANIAIVGNIKDYFGSVYPPYKMRAGEMIQISDFDGAIAQLTYDISGGSASSVAFVQRTSYSADRNALQVKLGSTSDMLNILLLRLGVNPGGVS